MAKIVVVRPPGCGSLNIRDLLTPMFSGPARRRHPDAKRQRKSRQRARDLRAARELKGRYVPLCFVDLTVYVRRYEPWGEWTGHRRWREVPYGR